MITIIAAHRRRRLSNVTLMWALLVRSIVTMMLLSTTTMTTTTTEGFRPTVPFSTITPSSSLLPFHRRRTSPSSPIADVAVQSSVGGRNNNNDGGGGGGGDGTGNNLGDFLDPMRRQESENLKRAREFMSETSLPISFPSHPGDSIDDDSDDEVVDSSLVANDAKDDGSSSLSPSSSSSSSLVGPGTRGGGMTTANASTSRSPSTSSALFGMEAPGQPSSDLLAKNPYLQVVSKVSPSDQIAKFTATADPRVQEAVRTTILGLIGSLPKLAFETTSITTGQRLASLMFQLQMTGYMFKNAEYRMSMSQSLGVMNGSSNLLLSGGKEEDSIHDLLDKEDDPLVSGKIKGKLKIRYGRSRLSGAPTTAGAEAHSSPERANTDATLPSQGEQGDGMEIEVDAAAYMSELREEVSKLRDELIETKEAKEDALRKDLLLFIRTLPAQELKSLTNTMSPEVLVCMKGLVQAVLAGIGDGQIGPDTVTEQSGEAMAQLCMWQLAVGYNLRELEVREEMKKNLQTILGADSSFEGGVDLSAPGALE